MSRLFVSYNYTICGGAASGFGNTEVKADRPQSVEDVRALEEFIADDMKSGGVSSPQVKIISWKSF